MANCIICNGNTFGKSFESRDGEILELFVCDNCGHVAQDVANYEDIYSDGAVSKEERKETDEIPSRNEIEELDSQAFKRYKKYKEWIVPGKSALVVGSSIGSFVHYLKMAGVGAEGLEPAPVFAAFSKVHYGFEQHNVLLEDFQSDKEYDCVFSFHVIEHVKNPQRFIQDIKKRVKPGGKLILECPSMELHLFGDLKSTVWKPHVHYFNAASLYHLLASDFSDINIDFFESGLSLSATRSEISRFNESVFEGYKKQAKRISKIVDFVPNLAFNDKLRFGRDLLMQTVFEKDGISSRFKKSVDFTEYSVKERFYLNKEAGSGPNRLVHITNYKGWGNNAGDIVLSSCVRNTLRKCKPKMSFDIRSLKDEINSSMIDAINCSKGLLIGGGGLFLPDTNPNAVSGWQWAVSKEQLEQIQVPVMLFAIGYNYFPGQKPSDFFVENLNHIVRKSEFIGIRNFGSIEAVKSLLDEDLKDKQIRFQPCPTTIIRKQLPQLPAKVKSRNVAVNIAFDRYEKRFGAQIYNKLHEVALALKELERMSYKIYNVAHLTKDEWAEAAFDRVGLKYETIRLQHKFPDEIYRFYNEMEVVIGMRGHAQMIPFGVNAKIITLGTHSKMKWFLQDVDLMEAYIDMMNTEALSEEIIQRFNFMVDPSNQVDERIAKAQDKLYAVTQENQAIIAEILK